MYPSGLSNNDLLQAIVANAVANGASPAASPGMTNWELIRVLVLQAGLTPVDNASERDLWKQWAESFGITILPNDDIRWILQKVVAANVGSTNPSASDTENDLLRKLG